MCKDTNCDGTPFPTFLVGWRVIDSTGKKVPVKFTYLPKTPTHPDLEIFGFYYDDTAMNEQGRIFTR